MLRRAALLLALMIGCTPPPPPAAPPADHAIAAQQSSSPPPSTTPVQPVATPTDSALPVATSLPIAQAPPSASPTGTPVLIRTNAPLSTGISQADVLAAVQKNAEAFDKCFTIGAAGSKSFKAKVTLRATVGPTGSVNAIQLVGSTSSNPLVDACVVRAVEKLSFVRPMGAGATVITFPLSFDGFEQVE